MLPAVAQLRHHHHADDTRAGGDSASRTGESPSSSVDLGSRHFILARSY
eukprot:COSAG06_NODE_48721_length_330_cov_0.666667_1_plen_48_part_01